MSTCSFSLEGAHSFKKNGIFIYIFESALLSGGIIYSFQMNNLNMIISFKEN